jgi:polyphosphate kinase
MVAPVDLREKLNALFDRENRTSTRGQTGAHHRQVQSVWRGLQIIEKLYEVSARRRAGGSDRGEAFACASGNSRFVGKTSECEASSVVSSEHSRVFWFSNGGDDRVYIGMPTGCRETSNTALRLLPR